MLTVLIVIICGLTNSAEIFTTIVNNWKSLPIVVKYSKILVGFLDQPLVKNGIQFYI